MTKIHDPIKQLINPARIATAAAELGETEHKITSAIGIILPVLLGKMIKFGDTPEIEAVLRDAEKLRIYENYNKIWKGSGIDTHENVGERFENRLLGAHDPQFNAAVGRVAGIKKEHIDRLTSWIAGTVAGWFADQMRAGHSYKSLLAELSGERESLYKAIPAEIRTEFGLDQVLRGAGSGVAHMAASKKKCSLCWLWWLLGILILAAIIFFCVRSCDREKPIETVVQPVETAAKKAIEIVTHEFVAPMSQKIAMILPDGTHITMYRGHLEEAVAAFLASDKYKNATDAELRTIWFEFTDIDFEHNSATDLMPGGQAQLVSLVNVLKKYPNVKIKVGAFADKTGTRATNLAISLKRAENIKAALERGGHPAADISVEGFGEEYARIPENASDDRRAPDRDIAMCFMK